MEPNYDVEPVVSAEQSVTQEAAHPEADASQGSSPADDKDYNFRTVVADRDKYKSEVDELRAKAEQAEQMVSMYKAMGYQTPQQAQGYQPQQQQVPQQQVMPNLDFGDAVDAEALQKLTGYFSQQAEQITAQTSAQKEQMEQLQLSVQDKNWRATIDKYLPGAMQNDPSIAETIRNSPKGWQAAYHFATHSMGYLQDQMKNQQSQEAERMIKNAEKPKTLANTGPQSNVGTHRDAFDMSAEEFEAIKKRLRAGTLNV